MSGPADKEDKPKLAAGCLTFFVGYAGMAFASTHLNRRLYGPDHGFWTNTAYWTLQIALVLTWLGMAFVVTGIGFRRQLAAWLPAVLGAALVVSTAAVAAALVLGSGFWFFDSRCSHPGCW